MLELSYAHLPRGAHGIYKHILFYWYSTFFAKKKPLGQKTDFDQFSQILPVKYPFGNFNSVFSHSRSILEQNVWKQTPHNRGVFWGGPFYDILPKNASQKAKLAKQNYTWLISAEDKNFRSIFSPFHVISENRLKIFFDHPWQFWINIIMFSVA